MKGDLVKYGSIHPTGEHLHILIPISGPLRIGIKRIIHTGNTLHPYPTALLKGRPPRFSVDTATGIGWLSYHIEKVGTAIPF